MESKFLTFEYFAGYLINTESEIYSVIDNKDHSQNKDLRVDLYSIETSDLDHFLADYNIDHLINESRDYDLQKRVWFYINYIHLNQYKKRIEHLLDKNERPLPYRNKNLVDIEIDKNNLCILNQFDLINMGIQKGNLVYTFCPILEQSNSNYWLFRRILFMAKEEKTILKIRLDPFVEISANNYHPVLYKMVVFGKPLNWRRILTLREDEFGQWIDIKDKNRYGITDYIWSPQKNEIHFTCEELPKISHWGLKTSRYFHAIFNKKTGEINHCDGAIRLYQDDELILRSKYHLKDPFVRKTGKRIKVFQFNSSENHGLEINKKTFCDLASTFFVWNYDVLRYFQ